MRAARTGPAGQLDGPRRSRLRARRAAQGLVLCLLVSACAHRVDPAAPPGREPLNSERIEAQYGSYGIELLSGDDPVRIANLYSLDGEQKTCRTFAVTVFPQRIDRRLDAVHREVLAGGSIGATLKGAGWTLEKRPLGVGEVPLSERLATVYALMGVPPAPLAFKAYDLYAQRDSATVRYATITEVYHPDYLTLPALRSAAGRPVASPRTLETLLHRIEQAAFGLAALPPGGRV